MFAAMLGLLIFLWGMALPLSHAPDPIGSAAQQFAEGARITVLLTVISGSIGIVLGILAGLGKLSPIWPIRWLCDFYVWLIRGTPLLLQILFVWLVLPQILPASIEISDFACAATALALNLALTTPSVCEPAFWPCHMVRLKRRARWVCLRLRPLSTSCCRRVCVWPCRRWRITSPHW